MLFVRTDFEIQKVQSLGFKSERLYHERLKYDVFYHPNFSIENQYLSLSFGQPNFHLRYYDKKDVLNRRNELLVDLALPFDFVSILFWDEKINPVVIRSGVWGRRLFRSNELGDKWSNLSDNIASLRVYFYTKARVFPKDDSIYVDDKYLILVTDKDNFLANREIVASHIDR